MFSIVACCHGAKLCAHAARDFRSQHKQDHIKRVHAGFENVEIVAVDDPKQKKSSFCAFPGSKKLSNVQGANDNSVQNSNIHTKEMGSPCIQDSDSNRNDNEEVNSGNEAKNEAELFTQTTLSSAKTMKELQTTSTLCQSMDYPNQPMLLNYNRKLYPGETTSRDFNTDNFKKYPWFTFNSTTKEMECYACQRYSNNNSFLYSNWRNPKKLIKHSNAMCHKLAMSKWL